MTSNLCDECCDFLMKGKLSIFEKETSDPTKIDRGKEVLEVQVKYVSLASMATSICDDRMPFTIAVGERATARRLFDFVSTQIQNVRQSPLNIF